MDTSITPTVSSELSDEELVDLYLSLPSKQREQRFVATKQAADITSVSLRTIQFWIETGAVRAVLVGKNYRVDLESVRAHLKRQLSSRHS